MRTLIAGATTLLPQGPERVDVVVEDGRIADVGPGAGLPVDQTVRADGLHLLPGVVDDQVHFREPGLTHKEDLTCATRACARGGVTTFLEMPNTSPTTTTCARLDEKLRLASTKARVNYGFYVGATPNNLRELCAAERTPGIKIFIGSSTGDLLVDEQEALEQIFEHTTLPITAHCEDEATVRANAERVGDPAGVAAHSVIRDHAAARIATTRALDLARRHRHRFHVLHVSTGDETDLIAGAILSGDGLITAEACPHHLLFSTEDYPRLGSLVQMNPSLKTPADRSRLWDALRAGVLQVVATDHAPHTLEEKQEPYPRSPSGLPAVENSLALMLNEAHHGRCTLQQVVHWMCDAPARAWDLVGKGRIEVGYDADLVLVDLQERHVVRNVDQLTKCGWSPWDGTELVGWPVRTWVNGLTVYADGRIDDAVRGREAVFDHTRGGYWATGGHGHTRFEGGIGHAVDTQQPSDPSMTEELWYLKQCDLFRRLGPEQLARLEPLCRSRVFKRGEPIYLPTEAADAVMVLAEGRVKIGSLTADGKQTILAFIEPGELFGELEALDGEAREEFAEAAEKSTVVLMPAQSLRDLLEQDASLAMGVTKLIGLRRRRVERRLKSLLYRSNRQRLVSLLLELADQYGQHSSDPPGVRLGIKLSHQDMASIIGSTRETVTVVLGELQSEGLLTVGRRKLVVADVATLRLAADGPLTNPEVVAEVK